MSTTPGAANVKFPPPLMYLAGLLVGIALSWLWPARVIPVPVALLLGIALLIAWLGLWIPALSSFARVRTPLSPRKPTTELVTTGVFRMSRNPIYLGWAMLYLGVAVLANSLWALALFVPVQALINFTVVGVEERYLEAKFGDQYRDYKKRVRRWL